ncbi:hypothetical protein BJ322DRAFT_1104389 [Thelephora terrestris]|uniref:Uncharacterized protein n=1 Tax=Thelephora terrestris TaxID=56493 RepID=A0A9P6HP49_9AGAM|nr:hypothetical protein BJ322DRAFT_1104389 [Thelephora terrestris]
MDNYELNFTIPSPGISTAFLEFSPSGRFLAVGDKGLSSLYILDKLAGFHPKLCATLSAAPTALVWETNETFYVGSSDGYFVHFRVYPKENQLVEGFGNGCLRKEGFPITAMALDVESRTLVISVGPSVFAFRRRGSTSEFSFTASISTRFNFKDPGTPAPPFPRSICFAPNNVLIITFCRQYIASIVLEFDGDSRLHSSFQTAKIDYSGLSLLKVITSANEEEIHRLTRVWVYGHASETDGGSFPFLFINGGAATLSGSSIGAAIIRDTVTHRENQLLEHTAIVNRAVSVIAYHVSNDAHNIATADRGEHATVRIWTARKRSLRLQIQHDFHVQKGWAISTLAVAFIIAALIKTVILPNTNKVSQFCIQIAVVFARLCIEIGCIVLDAVGGTVLDAGDALG